MSRTLIAPARALLRAGLLLLSLSLAALGMVAAIWAGTPGLAAPASSTPAPSATAGPVTPVASRTATPAPTSAPAPTPVAFVTPTPTPLPVPTPSASPTPTQSPTATPAPTPAPQPEDNTVLGYVVTGLATVQAEPSSDSAVVDTLSYEQPLKLISEVRGERVVVGDQDWPMAIQDWSDEWFQVDGGYVYSAYVWIPRSGDVLPDQLPGGVRRVDVDLSTQTASLLIDDQVVYTAPITSGKNGYETPTGVWHIVSQVTNETMTSAQAGIVDPKERYDVENVLFTQYFDYAGDALHLNYWQPDSVFGNARTSHGCVGLFIQDAQYFWFFGRPGMEVDVHDG
jgi:lipoprotein-anchoring transpeptidase ErfK/SrfK